MNNYTVLFFEECARCRQFEPNYKHRNCGFEKKCRRTFPWHVDQDGPMDSKVYSIIFYIRKES